MENAWEQLSERWLDGRRVTARWEFSRVRPENFPTRRIAGAAELLGRHLESGLLETCLGLLRPGEPKEVARKLLDRIATSSTFDYWSRHYDFDSPRRPGSGDLAHHRRLIGRDRAAEIVVNAVLPFAIAYGEHTANADLGPKALAVYHNLPAVSGNEITRHMAGLMMASENRRLVTRASRQQGLLHIYKTWCLDKMCGDCPANDL